jgi:hypothetical protein
MNEIIALLMLIGVFGFLIFIYVWILRRPQDFFPNKKKTSKKTNVLKRKIKNISRKYYLKSIIHRSLRVVNVS